MFHFLLQNYLVSYDLLIKKRKNLYKKRKIRKEKEKHESRVAIINNTPDEIAVSSGVLHL